MAGSAWTNELVDLIILSASASGFSGFFAYSPAPGANNLVASSTAAGGLDPYNNHYLANISSYGSGFAASLGSGFLTLYTGSLAGGWAAQATVGLSAGGILFLTAAAGITAADLLTAGAGLSVTGGETTDTLSVTGSGTAISAPNATAINFDQATIDVINGNVNLNMARPPNYTAVVNGTATAAQVEACLGGLLTSLTNRKLMA
jgi:hypothetical protein